MQTRVRAHYIEILFAVLLAAATVLTAWCAYQSARWNGVQAIRFAEANTNRSESVRQSNLAAQRQAVQVGVWVQYVNALGSDNELLADFLSKRFPPELQRANQAWLATKPLKNPDAPPTPFAMPEYSLPGFEEATRLANLADQRTAEAKQANEQSDHYVLLTVIFASVLFLGGVGSKFETYSVRLGALVVGWLILIGVFAVLLTFPVY